MKTILVIDDRSSQRELLRSLLSYAGHRVVTAGDGRSGLVCARDEAPDLIFCDVLMPVMDGYEFVRQLRADPHLADLEVVLVTAYFHEREALRLAAHLGVRRVLSKPCEPEEVLALVDQLFNGAGAAVEVSEDAALAEAHRRLLADRLVVAQDSLERVDRRLLDYVALNLSLAALQRTDQLLPALCEGAIELMQSRYAVAVLNGHGLFTTPTVSRRGFTAAGGDAAWRRFRPLPDGPRGPRRLSAFRLDGDASSREQCGLPDEFPAFQQALVAPIASPERRYGWLLVAESEATAGYADSDLSLLGTLAAHAGRIHENHQLLLRAQRHADQLQAEVAMRVGMQRRVELQYAVARVFIESERFEAALPQLLTVLLESLSVDLVALWERDRHQGCLRRLALHCRSEDATPSWYDLSPIRRPGEGMVGECWRDNQPVWRQPAAGGSAAAFPLRLHERVLGVVELASADSGVASVELVDALAAVGVQVAQFLERRHQFAQIRRLNRIHAVLSGINSVLVRVRERSQVLAEACQIAVRQGGFACAWVAFSEAADGPLLPLAMYADSDQLGQLPRQPRCQPQRLIARALQSAEPACSNHLLDDPLIASSECTALLEAGIHAFAALPLRAEQGAVGVLALCSRDSGVFTPGEIALLGELAEDISFALSTIRTRELLQYSSEHDALTGLRNRDGFQRRLQLALEQAPATVQAVLCCDLRRFRQVNESYGREAGDLLLREFARRLALHWSDCADLGRLGNDLFVARIEQPQSLQERVQAFSEWCQRDLGGAFVFGDHSVVTRACLGIAVYPADGETAAAVLERAEAALQRCKQSGQTYLFFQPEMTERVARTMRLEARLRQALREESLHLHYQPKVELADGRLVGFEALLRWRDSELGAVPPGDFVPLLEQTGLILEVGEWAMRRALQDLQRCPPTDTRVAVNVSPLQLVQSDFVTRVMQLCQAFGGQRHRLDLEITESLVMDDVEANIEKLAALGAAGVYCAIDDFGTGYSSLAYLARLPVQALKIDRSFVSGVLTQAESRAIVATTISLAHSLGLRVIAEGVETQAQARLLRDWQCDEIQGYLICRPLPIDDLLPWLERQR